LVPFLAGLLFIAIEYYLIYNLGHISKIVNSDKEAGVAIEPFVVWSNYSPNTLVAFLTSCFFPIVYCIVSKGAIFKEKMVQFATVNYIMGLSIWILFAEQGYRKFDANFCWQLIVASYLLFLSFLIQFVNDCRQRNIGINKQYIIGGAFLLHFIWGLVYWVKIIIFRGYF